MTLKKSILEIHVSGTVRQIVRFGADQRTQVQ